MSVLREHFLNHLLDWRYIVGERYIKREGGKDILYEVPDGKIFRTQADKKIGEVKETGFWDFGRGSHKVEEKGWLSSETKYVTEDKSLFSPRSNAKGATHDYVHKGDEGEETRFRYRPHSERWEPEESRGPGRGKAPPAGGGKPASPPSSRSQSAGSDDWEPSSSGSSRASRETDTSTPEASGQAPPKNTNGGSNVGEAILVVGVVVGTILLVNSLTRPSPSPRPSVAPPHPPLISAEEWRWLVFTGCLIVANVLFFLFGMGWLGKFSDSAQLDFLKIAFCMVFTLGGLGALNFSVLLHEIWKSYPKHRRSKRHWKARRQEEQRIRSREAEEELNRLLNGPPPE